MLEILNLVEKIEAVHKANENLLAAYKNSTKDVKDKFDRYKLPSALKLESFANYMQEWVNDTIDELQEVESYCVCKKENLEIDCEETFFYTAKVNFREDTVKFTDEIGPPHGQKDSITFKQYQEHFFEVPKEVYDFYMFLGNDGYAQEDYVRMIEKMYGEGQ